MFDLTKHRPSAKEHLGPESITELIPLDMDLMVEREHGVWEENSNGSDDFRVISTTYTHPAFDIDKLYLLRFMDRFITGRLEHLQVPHPNGRVGRIIDVWRFVPAIMIDDLMYGVFKDVTYSEQGYYFATHHSCDYGKLGPDNIDAMWELRLKKKDEPVETLADRNISLQL